MAVTEDLRCSEWMDCEHLGYLVEVKLNGGKKNTKRRVAFRFDRRSRPFSSMFKEPMVKDRTDGIVVGEEGGRSASTFLFPFPSPSQSAQSQFGAGSSSAE